MVYRIKTHNGGMSNRAFHKERSNRKFWWLRGPDGFVDLGGRYRGNDLLEVEVDLEPGERYTLGVGTREIGTRISFKAPVRGSYESEYEILVEPVEND